MFAYINLFFSSTYLILFMNFAFSFFFLIIAFYFQNHKLKEFYFKFFFLENLEIYLFLIGSN